MQGSTTGGETMTRLTAKLTALAAVALAFFASSANAQTIKPARVIFSKQTGQIVVADIPSNTTPQPPVVSNPTNTAVNFNSLTLGSYHRSRAQARYQQLSSADKSKFQSLFAAAASNRAEQAYLAKALAMQYPMTEIERFAREIRGKSNTWMRDNLHLAGNSTNRGVMQQWRDSCGPTTVQAMLGEFDPIYALRTHQRNPRLTEADNSNGSAMNPSLAGEQKVWLERARPDGSAGGIAVARSASGGRGRWCEDLMSMFSSRTGVTYTARHLGGAYTLDAALADLDRALNEGLPVPIVAKRSGGSHYVLAIGVRYSGGQRTYTLHDPWTGQTVTRTEAQFRSARLDLSGNHELATISMPNR